MPSGSRLREGSPGGAALLDEAVRRAFRARLGKEPAGVAFAPGRVNLVGDHTDYNEGFVLPIAIDRGTACAFAPRADGVLRVHATALETTREAEIAALAAPGGASFFDYVAGVAWALREAGHVLSGADLCVHGNLPVGAGLSSSASLELATARALAELSRLPWDPVAMARLAQRAENAYVGVSCGLMDQFAAAASRAGHALLLDCRSLEARPVPVPEAVAVVVLDTGVRRGLHASAYNERRAACESAVAALRALRPSLRALRDVDEALLEEGRPLLDPSVFPRAAHVVAETGRPLALAEAFARGDLEGAGRIVDASHFSLRDLYGVSSPELDRLTELARAHPACLGARLTGAGFGGCALALVRAPEANGFVEGVASAWARERPDLDGGAFACRPAEGACLARIIREAEVHPSE